MNWHPCQIIGALSVDTCKLANYVYSQYQVLAAPGLAPALSSAIPSYSPVRSSAHVLVNEYILPLQDACSI
jgi:hypothetical protein